MNSAFADTFVWLALVNSDDAWHSRVKFFLDSYAGRLLTTEWVLTELADALAGSELGRREFVSLLSDVEKGGDVTIVGSDTRLFHDAVDLYQRGLDKQWSLTDCTSFIVMERAGLRDALTGDHHFEQAGFTIHFK